MGLYDSNPRYQFSYSVYLIMTYTKATMDRPVLALQCWSLWWLSPSLQAGDRPTTRSAEAAARCPAAVEVLAEPSGENAAQRPNKQTITALLDCHRETVTAQRNSISTPSSPSTMSHGTCRSNHSWQCSRNLSTPPTKFSRFVQLIL